MTLFPSHDGETILGHDDRNSRDLYEFYAEYQRKYARASVEIQGVRGQCPSPNHNLIMYERTEFWNWFTQLPPDRQQLLRTRWEIGYDEDLRRAAEDLDLEFRRISNFGLPEHLQRFADRIYKIMREEDERATSPHEKHLDS